MRARRLRVVQLHPFAAKLRRRNGNAETVALGLLLGKAVSAARLAVTHVPIALAIPLLPLPFAIPLPLLLLVLSLLLALALELLLPLAPIPLNHLPLAIPGHLLSLALLFFPALLFKIPLTLYAIPFAVHVPLREAPGTHVPALPVVARTRHPLWLRLRLWPWWRRWRRLRSLRIWWDVVLLRWELAFHGPRV